MFDWLLQTDTDTLFNVVTLALRLALGLVIFPHGAQKLLGWFGGFGFKGTMGYFTQTVGAPYVLGFLAILTESIGALALASGLFTRVAALGIAIVMVVAAYVVHRSHGFFMNWFGAQQGEGYEFHILAATIAVALFITGGGAWSLDHLLFLAR